MPGLKNKAEGLVSVYIPTRNRAKALARAIDSVLAQKYSAIEVVVADDCSSDDTESVMKSYCQQYDNIRYIKNAEQKGACFTRNQAVNRAAGDFVIGLDDDDYYLPDFIERLMASYDADYSFVCETNLIERNGKLVQGNMYAGEITQDMILGYNYAGSQALMRRDDFISLGGFDSSFPAWQDHDLWVRLIIKYGSAKKIKGGGYVHVDHSSDDRITNTDNINNAYVLFIEKYKSYLSAGNKRSLRFVFARHTNKLTLKLLVEMLFSRDAGRVVKFGLGRAKRLFLG